MESKPLDTRRRASRADIDAYFADFEPELSCGAGNHFTDFPLHQNIDFERHEWRWLGDTGFQGLTRAQQVLCILERVEGQINNGGIEQLFLNDFAYAGVLRDGVGEFRWGELAARFERYHEGIFGAPESRARFELLRAAFCDDEADASDRFADLTAEFPGEAFNEWFSSRATQEVFRSELARFLAEREDELFVVIGGREVG